MSLRTRSGTRPARMAARREHRRPTPHRGTSTGHSSTIPINPSGHNRKRARFSHFTRATARRRTRHLRECRSSNRSGTKSDDASAERQLTSDPGGILGIRTPTAVVQTVAGHGVHRGDAVHEQTRCRHARRRVADTRRAGGIHSAFVTLGSGTVDQSTGSSKPLPDHCVPR